MVEISEVITDEYAIYNMDCVDGMKNMTDDSVDLSMYSPPFGGLYHYSSDERDLSNNNDYKGFFDHYEFVVKELARITKPGRLTAVHCMDIPSGNSGCDHLIDFQGDIIRLHEKLGFHFKDRYAIWKEPLAVRNRTMMKNLAHQTIVQDATLSANAGGDYVLVFRNSGKNEVPVTNPTGLQNYAGRREIPSELYSYKNWTGKQTENRYSHWIWRNYASCFWDDIRIERVLPFKAARDSDDEKHVHPLQLDVIERITVLYSNPGETVLTPFMGVGSEVYIPTKLGRKGVGFELKKSYFKQAIQNMESVNEADIIDDMFDGVENEI